MKDLTSRPVLLVDFGGVLVQDAEHAALTEWQQRLGLGDQSVAYAIFQNITSRRAMLGQVHERDLFNALGAHLQLSLREAHELWESFWQSQVLNEALFEYLRGLTRHADIAICSNFWPNYGEIMLERFRLHRLTRDLFVSSELACMKPSRELFTHVTDRFGSHRRFALVDDAIENVEGAERCGIKGIFHQATDRSIEQIERWLAGHEDNLTRIEARVAEL